MAYPLSATKLQSYARCPRSYYYRYEYGLKDSAAFGSAALGNALHLALANIYKDWHYQAPQPPLGWLRQCWDAQLQRLTNKQIDEGWQILKRYYDQHIANGTLFNRPIAVEGRIDASLIAQGIEFKLSGRYDRLDATGTTTHSGLNLIDYKSTKNPQPLDANSIDLQLGLYAIALEQRYGQVLHQMSLLYLRTGQVVTFEATAEHRTKVEAIVGEMALKLLRDEDWQPHCGAECDRCLYARYCPAMSEQPEVLPERAARKRRGIQLSLGV